MTLCTCRGVQNLCSSGWLSSVRNQKILEKCAFMTRLGLCRIWFQKPICASLEDGWTGETGMCDTDGWFQWFPGTSWVDGFPQSPSQLLNSPLFPSQIFFTKFEANCLDSGTKWYKFHHFLWTPKIIVCVRQFGGCDDNGSCRLDEGHWLSTDEELFYCECDHWYFQIILAR